MGGRGRPKIRDLDGLLKLYEEGLSTIELAKRFGVSQQAVWRRLKSLGRTRDRSAAQRVRWMKVRGSG